MAPVKLEQVEVRGLAPERLEPLIGAEQRRPSRQRR